MGPVEMTMDPGISRILGLRECADGMDQDLWVTIQVVLWE